MEKELPRPLRKRSNRCSSCMMIEAHCICPEIPKIDTKTKLCLIIQNRETKKPTNTGLLAAQCLMNSEVFVRGKVNAPLNFAEMLDESYENLFLFPSLDAEALDAVDLSGSKKPIKLFVADGNWGQAIRIHRRFQESCAIKDVMIPIGKPTRYRIRKEHGRPEGLATIEAIARAFGIVEGPEVERSLENIFETMVTRTLRSRGIDLGPSST